MASPVKIIQMTRRDSRTKVIKFFLSLPTISVPNTTDPQIYPFVNPVLITLLKVN